MSDNLILDSQIASDPLHILADSASVESGDDVFVFPLSFAQQRLWFMEQLEPGSGLYNIAVALRLTGHLDLPALSSCLSDLVKRHETLRTRFRVVDGEVMQVIEPSPSASHSISLIDLSSLSPLSRASEIDRL